MPTCATARSNAARASSNRCTCSQSSPATSSALSTGAPGSPAANCSDSMAVACVRNAPISSRSLCAAAAAAMRTSRAISADPGRCPDSVSSAAIASRTGASDSSRPSLLVGLRRRKQAAKIQGSDLGCLAASGRRVAKAVDSPGQVERLHPGRGVREPRRRGRRTRLGPEYRHRDQKRKHEVRILKHQAQSARRGLGSPVSSLR